jgi:uncharacterized protein YutE (UPF0331/DUF86 family)
MERERIAEELARTPGLLFAVLFGSRTTERARADSDWDLGIYLDESGGPAQHERVRARLIAALEPSVPVDVVLLNEAPALRPGAHSMASACCSAIPVPGSGSRSAPWPPRETRPTGATCTRASATAGSRSDALVDRDVFDRRLGKLEALLRDLRGLAATDRASFLASHGLQAQAERWLQLAAECALDLAHHLIADRGWKTPGSYREAFEILRAEGVLDAVLADQMQGWAGLRDVLTHAYLDVDHSRLHEILTSELEQLAAYAAALHAALAPGIER